MHLLVTDYEGASLECQSLQLLPGVPTLKCEPPELPQENLQEVHGECWGEFSKGPESRPLTS